MRPDSLNCAARRPAALTRDGAGQVLFDLIDRQLDEVLVELDADRGFDRVAIGRTNDAERARRRILSLSAVSPRHCAMRILS